MDIQLTAVDAATGRRADVVVVAEAESTVADVERELRRLLGVEAVASSATRALSAVPAPTRLIASPQQTTGFGPPPPPPPAPAMPLSARYSQPGGLWVAGRPVNPDLRVTLSPLRHGAMVGIGGPVGTGAHDTDVGGVAEVRVVGGPDAGRVHRLPLGEYLLGSAHDAEVFIADQSVAPRQARLRVTPRDVEWIPFDDAAPAKLERKDLREPQKLRPAQLLAVGKTRLMVVPAEAPDAALVPSDDGGLAYNRPPRIPPAPITRRVILPHEPKEAGKPPIPIFMVLAPMAMGAVAIVMFKSAYYALMMLLSPIMMVGNYMTQRKTGKKTYRQQMADYRQNLAEARKKLRRDADVERSTRRYDAPDPAAVLVTALGPRRRLWERRRRDEDTLVLRLGTAEQMSEIKVEGGEDKLNDDTPKAPMLNDVPVTVPLAEVGVMGVAGPHAQVHQTARWLIAQAAALHSPRDLSIIVLTDEHGREEWEWMRWIPHATPDGMEIVSVTGTTSETTARRVGELVHTVTERQGKSNDIVRTLDKKRPTEFPATLVVLDGSRALRSLPGLPQVLRDGPAVGVYAICLDSEERLLPEECGVVATYDPTDLCMLSVRRAYGMQLAGVLADQVSLPWCERFARALAPIRDAGSEEGDVILPHSVRLLDLLALEPPTPEAVMSAWKLGGRTTDTRIGVCVEGPFHIDMKNDGPHALVAGTTGAGKSELLQSIIASLAVSNRPNAMTFVLIDYKGGAAFKDCVHLPHTVGMVTDLDGHLTERALASLDAELKRREHLLATVGAKDIEDYWDTVDGADFVPPSDEPVDPMPRCILIIDEFASLVEELPDFVTGLVGIAMRGRSLGVHLILATQRPSGVVSPVIRANTNLRIALRVTDDGESRDVIDATEAGRIPKGLAGRGYARTGYSALTAFQTGRVGGRRPGAVAGPPQVAVVPVAWEQLGAPIPHPESNEDDSNMETDLQVLVGAINKASDRTGIGRYRSPWLPPLPEEVTLDALPASRELPALDDRGGRVAAVPFGLQDLPDQQLQETVYFDIEHGSHLIIAGAPRSGRSTALRTIAAGIARNTSSRDVHIYALDCGNAAMIPLNELPHCGAVVTRDQVDRADRLLSVLVDEITRRQVLMAQYGYGSLAEQRASVDPDQRLPYLVFLLDRWEGFMSSFDDIDAGRMTQTVYRLLREGPGVGLRVVIGGDRSALLGRLPTAIEEKLVLRLSDRSDYGLAGLAVKRMPDKMPPGRAFRNDSMVETHFALLDKDPAGPAQVKALLQIGKEAAERDRSIPRRKRAARVDVLPARISVADTLALADEPRPDSPMWALVGVGGDELAPLGVDLTDDGPGYVIGGPPRSGRSTALLTMATSLAEGGAEMVIVTPRPSPLRGLEGRPGVLGILSGNSIVDTDIIELLDQALGPVVVCVDDAELLSDSPASHVFETVLREGRDTQRALVIAGTTSDMTVGYRGFIIEARKSRSGFLINPEHPMEGELLSIKPPRSSVGPGPRGRGLFVRRGSFMAAQVPLPPGEE